MIPLILKLDGAKFILTEKFCQDAVEIYFGKQRAKGRRNENPTVQQFIYNNQAIITGKSLVSGHCSNIRKVGTKLDVNELSSPLRKRKAKSRILKYNN